MEWLMPAIAVLFAATMVLRYQRNEAARALARTSDGLAACRVGSASLRERVEHLWIMSRGADLPPDVERHLRIMCDAAGIHITSKERALSEERAPTIGRDVRHEHQGHVGGARGWMVS